MLWPEKLFWSRLMFLRCPHPPKRDIRVRLAALVLALGAPASLIIPPCAARAQAPGRAHAMRAAIHPVSDVATMRQWLARVPATHTFPPDFEETLKGQGALYVIEMTTSRGCVPCGDLWIQLRQLGGRYGWQVRTLTGQAGALRSGRLGLPWVGDPVAWVRPISDPDRTVPIAVGTDRAPNLARNLYLAAKMLTGVRPAVAVRAMSKFTGIVAAQTQTRGAR